MIRRRAPRPVDGPASLAAVSLTVARGGRPVLHAVDLEVRPGELVALVGPNGAGKSTLLAALAGEVVPVAGEVHLDGRPLPLHHPRAAARRRAVLPQHHAVAFPFTAAQVIRLGRAPWQGTPRAGADEPAVDAAVRDCGVAHLLDRPFPALSGGERARVALARVLAQDAPLLLLDEPTAALDVGHQEQVFAAVRRRVDRGVGALAVLHDLTTAAAHADRVVLLCEGVVVADGPPRSSLAPDLLATAYRHPIDVFPNPVTGLVTVVPRPPADARPPAAPPVGAAAAPTRPGPGAP